MSRKPGWPCASTIAGITVLPVRSTRRAPAGTASAPLRPTAVMRLPSTTKAESSIGVPPSPVISRAPSNTVTAGACAAAGDDAAAASRTTASKRPHDDGRRRMKILPIIAVVMECPTIELVTCFLCFSGKTYEVFKQFQQAGFIPEGAHFLDACPLSGQLGQ